MTEVIDWRTTPDPHAALRAARAHLRAGRLVALPTEAGCVLAAAGLAPEAVGRLPADGGAPPVLAVRGMADARDWAPGLAGAGRRLAKRLWPGPLTLAVAGGGEGLASRLPAEVRSRLQPEGALHLRAPAHEVVQEIAATLAGPLVLAADPGPPEGGVDLVIDDGPPRYAGGCTVVRVEGEAWEVVRPGLVPEEQLARQATCLVVFVCTGNTCRSPMAEALFRRRLVDRLGCAPEDLVNKGFCVLSAGLSAMMGGEAAPEAVEVARSFGADLAAHRSQPLTPELAAQADCLVAMTRGHVRALEHHFPRLGARPRLLDPAGDVADPIGCDRAVYEECGQQIWQHLEALVSEVCP
jgi:protein-tyrosine phosphatase